MPHISVSGVDLHYVDEGEGKPVFFLHGNAGSGRVWRKITPEFKKRYRVIAHDRQGFGDSEKKESGDFSPRGFAGELARLMDALDIERAHVCGLSMGGMIAQCFALDYPERVNGLVLVGTMPDRTGRNVPETLAELERDGWPAVAERLIDHWFRPGSDEADVAEAYEIALQSPQKFRELTVTALGTFDIKAELPNIEAPTLILNGEADVTNVMGHAEIMNEGIPGSRLVRIPDCGHLIPIERPEAFCRHTLGFLAEVDAMP